MGKMKSQIFTEIGTIISHLYQNDFAQSLIAFIQTQLQFDHALLLAYRGKPAPMVLYKSYRDGTAELSLPEYISSAYMLDPVYAAHLNRISAGVYPLQDIAPDRFRNTAYYKNYYRKTGYSDEVICLAYSDTGYTLALSLFLQSQDDKRFTQRDISKLRDASSTLCALMQQQWKNLSVAQSDKNKDEEDPLTRRIKQAILESEKVELTLRQCEIIALTLRGHSSASISLILNISTETVKVHRRNIYAKLRISSQNQLFLMITSAIGPLTC